MTTALPTFFDQLARAWRLFISRWGVAVVLELIMLIPAMLMIPLVLEYLSAVYQNVDTNQVLANSIYTGQFIWGFFGTILFGVLSMTAMIIAFAAKKPISLLVALTSAVRRYIPVLYTSILASLVVVLSFLPAELLQIWYTALRSSLPISGSGLTAVDVVVLVAFIALLIPALIVSIWVMYAPLAVALKEVSGGFTALWFSKEIVQQHMWSLAWRVIGTLVLFEIVSLSVSVLPLAAVIVPFVLMILTIAFFVELYKELRVR
ncbi:MAG TPA: hypothetical protein VLG69_03105 [Candidatus Andersenbacteria bacterium]|nr:hypothetical protein [Candidatus Andersenbacteria bacterium]